MAGDGERVWVATPPPAAWPLPARYTADTRPPHTPPADHLSPWKRRLPATRPCRLVRQRCWGMGSLNPVPVVTAHRVHHPEYATSVYHVTLSPRCTGSLTRHQRGSRPGAVPDCSEAKMTAPCRCPRRLLLAPSTPHTNHHNHLEPSHLASAPGLAQSVDHIHLMGRARVRVRARGWRWRERWGEMLLKHQGRQVGLTTMAV